MALTFDFSMVVGVVSFVVVSCVVVHCPSSIIIASSIVHLFQNENGSKLCCFLTHSFSSFIFSFDLCVEFRTSVPAKKYRMTLHSKSEVRRLEEKKIHWMLTECSMSMTRTIMNAQCSMLNSYTQHRTNHCLAYTYTFTKNQSNQIRSRTLATETT